MAIALLGASLAVGESRLFLFLIFPIVEIGGWVGALGAILLLAGLFALFLSFATVAHEPRAPPFPRSAGGTPPTAARRFGGVVFVGPIPIVFGSDRGVASWMMILGAVLLVLLIAWFLLTVR